MLFSFPLHSFGSKPLSSSTTLTTTKTREKNKEANHLDQSQSFKGEVNSRDWKDDWIECLVANWGSRGGGWKGRGGLSSARRGCVVESGGKEGGLWGGDNIRYTALGL